MAAKDVLGPANMRRRNFIRLFGPEAGWADHPEVIATIEACIKQTCTEPISQIEPARPKGRAWL